MTGSGGSFSRGRYSRLLLPAGIRRCSSSVSSTGTSRPQISILVSRNSASSGSITSGTRAAAGSPADSRQNTRGPRSTQAWPRTSSIRSWPTVSRGAKGSSRLQVKPSGASTRRAWYPGSSGASRPERRAPSAHAGTRSRSSKPTPLLSRTEKRMLPEKGYSVS